MGKLVFFDNQEPRVRTFDEFITMFPDGRFEVKRFNGVAILRSGGNRKVLRLDADTLLPMRRWDWASCLCGAGLMVVLEGLLLMVATI